jgi:RNA polymerase sigma-70 factor, ECF subfamily
MESASTARHAAFERRAREIVEPVRRFLARRTDPATADDVLSEVMLVLWRRSAEVPDDLLPWTYRVAANCLANAERGARRQRRLAGRIATLDPPAEVLPEAPDFELVHRALQRLKPSDAEVLRLWAWEQLTTAEIAVVLDLTPNAAAVRLHRARERFKRLIGKQASAEGHERETEGEGHD